MSLLATRAVIMVDCLPRACKFFGPFKWLVETQNKILSRIAILSYTPSVQVASRDEKISLSESNLILQQATIDPEQAKNYL